MTKMATTEKNWNELQEGLKRVKTELTMKKDPPRGSSRREDPYHRPQIIDNLTVTTDKSRDSRQQSKKTTPHSSRQESSYPQYNNMENIPPYMYPPPQMMYPYPPFMYPPPMYPPSAWMQPQPQQQSKKHRKKDSGKVPPNYPMPFFPPMPPYAPGTPASSVHSRHAEIPKKSIYDYLRKNTPQYRSNSVPGISADIQSLSQIRDVDDISITYDRPGSARSDPAIDDPDRWSVHSKEGVRGSMPDKYQHRNHGDAPYHTVTPRTNAARTIQSAYRGYQGRKMFPYLGGLVDDPSVLTFSDQFIGDILEDEIIPDILIDVVMSEQTNHKDWRDEFSSPTDDGLAADVSEEMLNGEIRRQIWDIVAEATNALVDDYLSRLAYVDPVQEFYDEILTSTVGREIFSLLKSQVNENADSMLARAQAYDAIESLHEEGVRNEIPDIVREAIFEIILENYIADDLVPEITDPLCVEIARDLLSQLDNKVSRMQYDSIRSYATEKLIDGFCLDDLLRMLARNSRIYTEAEYADRFLDEMMMNMLLGQYFSVRNHIDYTVRNKPLQRLHEKLFTDIGLDILLTELGEQLDEDMADLHEYEQQLDDPYTLEDVALGLAPVPDALRSWINDVDSGNLNNDQNS